MTQAPRPNIRMFKQHSRLWLVAALAVVAIHLSVTFLTTLAAEDWRQCFDASGVTSRPYRYPVRDYPWTKYMTYFIWSIASAAPAMIGLALLRSQAIAILCAALLAPLIWSVLGDYSLMLGELFSGATVTAQGGWHHCDRKGYDVAEISRFWIYISSSIIGLATLTLWLVRCSRQRGKRAT